jgi:hypothetical protein
MVARVYTDRDQSQLSAAGSLCWTLGWKRSTSIRALGRELGAGIHDGP